MRRGPLAAVVLVLLLAACAPTSAPRMTWWSGMSGALLRHCSSESGPTTVTNLQTGPLSWRFGTETAVLRGGWDLPSPVLYQLGSPKLVDFRAAAAVDRCMARYPIDWSLALDDTASTRARLYPWYRDILLPCLRDLGFGELRMPSAREFLSAPYDRYDPYAAIYVDRPDVAMLIQSRCPPAPPDVIAQVHLAASSGSR